MQHPLYEVWPKGIDWVIPIIYLIAYIGLGCGCIKHVLPILHIQARSLMSLLWVCVVSVWSQDVLVLYECHDAENMEQCLNVLIWPWHSEVDSWPWTAFNGPEPTPHWYMTCTCDCIYSFNVLLMMGAESTRSMYNSFAVNNKDDCLKLHHVGYLINRVMMHGTTNIKYKKKCLNVLNFGRSLQWKTVLELTILILVTIIIILHCFFINRMSQ
jgi:hypothetical protein